MCDEFWRTSGYMELKKGLMEVRNDAKGNNQALPRAGY